MATRTSTLVKGSNLTDAQLRQVAAAFVHRWTAIGPGKHYPTEAAWIRDHSFHFTKAGRLMDRRAAMPHYLANPAAALGTSFVRAKVRRLPNGRIHLMILGTPRKQKRTVKRGSKRARAGSRR